MTLTRRRLLTRALRAGALGAAAPLALLPRDDLAGAAAGGLSGRAGTRAARRLPAPPASALPFAPGELLRYAVSFNGFAAGEATLEVIGPRTIDRKSGLLVRYTAESRGLVRVFYRLSDRIESLLDPLLLFTERYEAWLEQGRRRRHRVVVFEPDEGRFLRTGSDDGPTVIGPLDHRAVDGLGLIYHLRIRSLEPGSRLVVPLYRKARVTTVTLGAGRPALTETPAGRFETVEVRSIDAADADREGSGLVGGSLAVWYTTDRRHLPVRLAGRARPGPIDARLRSVRVPPAEGTR